MSQTMGYYNFKCKSANIVESFCVFSYYVTLPIFNHDLWENNKCQGLESVDGSWRFIYNPLPKTNTVVGGNPTSYGILALCAVNGLSMVYWVVRTLPKFGYVKQGVVQKANPSIAFLYGDALLVKISTFFNPFPALTIGIIIEENVYNYRQPLSKNSWE